MSRSTQNVGDTRAEDSFTAHDWACVEFLERVRDGLLKDKLRQWRDQCRDDPEGPLRFNLVQAFQYVERLRRGSPPLRSRLLGADEISETAELSVHEFDTHLAKWGHILFNSKQYALVRAFGASSLIPIILGSEAMRKVKSDAAVQKFFDDRKLPYYLNPNFRATYESQLLPCNAGLTPYQVTLFERGTVPRVTLIPQFLGDLSILHKREDFVQGHLSALLAVLPSLEEGDRPHPRHALGAYVLTCALPDAFTENDVWQLNQIVDGVTRLGMLPTLQSQQQWSLSRDTRATVRLPDSLPATDQDTQEIDAAKQALANLLESQVPNQLESGLLALVGKIGGEEQRVTAVAVNLDGIHRLTKTLFPTGPWLAPTLVCDAEPGDGGSELDTVNVKRLRRLCEQLVAVFDSSGEDTGPAMHSLAKSSSLFCDWVSSICPEVWPGVGPGMGRATPADVAACVRVWHLDGLSPERAIITVSEPGSDNVAEGVEERLQDLARLAVLAAKLASMPEGENRILAEVEQKWSLYPAGSELSEGSDPSEPPVSTHDAITGAEQYLNTPSNRRYASGPEVVDAVRNAMVNEINALAGGENGFRALLLVKKRRIFIPDIDPSLPVPFSDRYLSYPSFWLFERLSHVFGTDFLQDSVFSGTHFADAAIPPAGPFQRRRREYPHVEVTSGPDDAVSARAATWLSFFGVPISRWEESVAQPFSIFVSDRKHSKFVRAYRHYLNNLMSSAPSVASISRIFSDALLKVEMGEPTSTPSEFVTHNLLIKGVDGERPIVWNAHSTVELEMSCLGREGIFAAWNADREFYHDDEDPQDGFKPAPLQVGSNPPLPKKFNSKLKEKFDFLYGLSDRALHSRRTESRLEDMDASLVDLAHDVNNMLHTLNGWAELAETNEKRRADLPRIASREAGQIHEFMDAVLHALGMKNGGEELTRKRVPLLEKVREKLEFLEIDLEKRQIEVENRVEDGVGSEVTADPRSLHRVLYNLFENAKKYTPRGGKIVVDTVLEGDLVDLRIFNTGDKEHMKGGQWVDEKRIFQRGNRGNRDKGEIRGLGIGLSSAADLTRLMDGTLDVENLEDGPRFHLRLPRAEPR